MTRPNRRPSPLVRRHGERQQKLLSAANRAARFAESVIGRAWRDLLTVLREGGFRVYQRALAVLRRIPLAMTAVLTSELSRIYRHSHRLTVSAMRPELRAINSVANLGITGLSLGNLVGTGGRLGVPAPLTEQEDDAPGTVRFAGLLRRLLAGPAAAARALAGTENEEERERLFAQLLMPAPPEDEVLRALAKYVRPADWQTVGYTEKKLPEEIARRLAVGLALGQTQQQLAKDLRPYFDGSRVRARRAARTFGMDVATEAQFAAWDGLGDEIVGYQVHATEDEYTRPWHQDRDGTIYWRVPKPGQKGLSQMPRPPLEADDPRERPLDAPKIAWNCRCWLTPVLRTLGDE